MHAKKGVMESSRSALLGLKYGDFRCNLCSDIFSYLSTLKGYPPMSTFYRSISMHALAASVLMAAFSSSAFATTQPIDPDVRLAIQKTQADLKKEGCEYQYRGHVKGAFAEFNNAVAVEFTYEGCGGSNQGGTQFDFYDLTPNKLKKITTLNGGAFGNRRLEKGQFVVEEFDYADDDARCCPSKLLLRSYRLEKGKLKMVSESPVKAKR